VVKQHSKGSVKEDHDVISILQNGIVPFKVRAEKGKVKRAGTLFLRVQWVLKNRGSEKKFMRRPKQV